MEWTLWRPPPSAIAAAIALAMLWLIEGAWPFFSRPDRRRHGLRNVGLGLINGATRALFYPAVLLMVTSLTRVYDFGLLHKVAVPGWSGFLIAVLALDLVGYAWHIACHQWRFLWRFHAVHHHDDEVDSTTAFRFHVGEVMASSMVTVAAAAVLGLGMLHVLVYEALVVPFSIFHHGNARLPGWLDRVLGWLIVTPRMHWVHHSRWVEETDSNYSGIFSFWDRLFGTLREREDPHRLRLGLDGYSSEDQTLRGCLLTPFGPVKSRPGRDTRVRAGSAKDRTLRPCPIPPPRCDPLTNPG
jgi:sterol desaturase/sphingolipid hydroxylase (fatty acid hydroxylase superfamily)